MKSSMSQNGGRRGTSLLEVMFAMGVAIIGLLGVASLVIVAGHRLGESRKADVSGLYAREIAERFRVEGFDRHDYRFADGSPFELPVENGERVAIPFCLDPLMVAGQVVVDGGPGLVGTFPRGGPAEFRIPRVGPAMLFESPAGGQLAEEARRLIADRMMRARDDLVFERPRERTSPPAGLLVRDSDGTEITREYLGKYSWFATLVPSARATDHYILSIVVLHLRSSDLDNESEAWFPVRFLYDGENGGGAAVIRDVDQDQQFRGSGDSWLFLRQHPGHRAGWYRARIDRDPIIASHLEDDPMLTPGDVGGRGAYLTGGDWPVVPGTVDAMAVWVKGVVLVAERTVRLKR
jgi:hypothetical protein